MPLGSVVPCSFVRVVTLAVMMGFNGGQVSMRVVREGCHAEHQTHRHYIKYPSHILPLPAGSYWVAYSILLSLRID